MERVERTYLVGQEMVKVAAPGGGSSLTERNRVKVMQESLAELIYMCPKGDRVLATRLQQAWVELERERRKFPVVPNDQAVLELD
jgi:hypothetical protein